MHLFDHENIFKKTCKVMKFHIWYGENRRRKIEKILKCSKETEEETKVRIDDFTTGKRKDRNTIIIEDEDVDKEIVDANNPFKKLKSLRTFASRSISNNNMKKRRNTKNKLILIMYINLNLSMVVVVVVVVMMQIKH